MPRLIQQWQGKFYFSISQHAACYWIGL